MASSQQLISPQILSAIAAGFSYEGGWGQEPRENDKSRAAALKVKTMLCVFLNRELATVCVPWYMCPTVYACIEVEYTCRFCEFSSHLINCYSFS